VSCLGRTIAGGLSQTAPTSSISDCFINITELEKLLLSLASAMVADLAAYPAIGPQPISGRSGFLLFAGGAPLRAPRRVFQSERSWISAGNKMSARRQQAFVALL
jgi:hypothetical protein